MRGGPAVRRRRDDRSVSVEETIARYGYFALFFGVLLEGETFVVAASFAAHQGYLDLPWVVVVSFLGSVAGDDFYFFLGRKKGRRYLKARPHWQARVAKAESLLRRHHRLAIAGFRFIYGFRTITPIAIGMSDIKAARFVLLDAVGALAWSLIVGVLGFFFGSLLEALVADLRRHERLVLLAIFVVGALLWTCLRAKKKVEKGGPVG